VLLTLLCKVETKVFLESIYNFACLYIDSDSKAFLFINRSGHDFESAYETVFCSFDMAFSFVADLYAFNIGCYVLWATAAAVQYVVDYLRTHDIRVFLRQVVKWSSIVAKSFVLLSLWVRVVFSHLQASLLCCVILLVIEIDQPN
jgi:hypothetical protein